MITMPAVEEPGIDRCYVNKVPKDFDVPPSGLEIDSVQCDEHVSLINTSHPFIVAQDQLWALDAHPFPVFWGPPLY
jgi:hypothetical protein